MKRPRSFRATKMEKGRPTTGVNVTPVDDGPPLPRLPAGWSMDQTRVEAHVRIDQLEQRVADLEARLAKLEKP